jgi:dTDP-D-glucose 4,6-dehydratase
MHRNKLQMRNYEPLNIIENERAGFIGSNFIHYQLSPDAKATTYNLYGLTCMSSPFGLMIYANSDQYSFNTLAGKLLPIHGNSQQLCDCLCVDVDCAAVWRAISTGEPSPTYSVGGNNEMANNKIVHSICDLLDELKPCKDAHSYRNQLQFIGDRPGRDRRYAVVVSRIANELGSTLHETFTAGIRKTVQWHLGGSFMAGRASGRIKHSAV